MRKALSSGLLAALLVTGAARAKAIDPNINHYICKKLDDFSATMTVVMANQRELGKISRDAGMLYRFHDVMMRYKEPNKIRIEGTAEGTKGIFVFDDTKQLVSVPSMHIKTRRDYRNDPGKRKSLIDVGLISEFYLTYSDAQFLREATVGDTPCAVFELHYKKQLGDTSHHIVYIDPKTKVIRKRESYSQTGKLQAIYFYNDVREVAPGIWFPTRIEAQNTDRQIAGITAYKDIKVNVGVPDSVFQI